jgi:hypothetical protein
MRTFFAGAKADQIINLQEVVIMKRVLFVKPKVSQKTT